MRRFAGTLLSGSRWAAALAIALIVPLAVRAQAPINPLRTGATVRVSSDTAPARTVRPRPDVFAEVPRSEVRQVLATEDVPPPEPQSVVPPQFGQPTDPYDGPRYGYLPEGSSPEHWPAEAPANHALHQPWFTHGDPNDPYRHVGLGSPLIGTSWLNRPWYGGVFLGALLADDLIDGEVLSNNSYFIGGRLGWDFDHYWGLEGRYAFSKPQINDANGLPLAEHSRNYFLDLSLVYYPWGDSRWRPYGSLGLGVQTFRFLDTNGISDHQSLLSLPIGVGIKYLHSPCCNMRFEAYDNIAFGDGRLDTMQNITLMMGVEFRFGARPRHYFPWHGNIAGW